MRVQIYAALQLLDERLARLTEARRALSDELHERAALQALDRERHDRTAALAREQGRAGELERDLLMATNRLHQLIAQQRGEAGEPLVAREIAVLHDTCRGLEERLQVQRQQVEAAAHALANVEGAWREHSAAWTEREPRLQAEWEQLTRALKELQHERRLLAERLDATALALYADLQRRHRGTAIAPIRNRQCGSCHARLPAAVFDLLAGPDPLVRCPRCGRVLLMQHDHQRSGESDEGTHDATP